MPDKRDPRKNPKVGDVVQPPELIGLPTVEVSVQAVCGNLVGTLHHEIRWITLEDWRYFYRNAKVVNHAG